MSAAGIAPAVLAREPEAPEALARRVTQLLEAVDARGDGRDDAIERHVAAAEQTVARLLRDQSTSRASALDLLAADALATYAFELAADDPDAIPELAARAMARFAAVGAAAPSVALPGVAPPDAAAPSVGAGHAEVTA